MNSKEVLRITYGLKEVLVYLFDGKYTVDVYLENKLVSSFDGITTEQKAVRIAKDCA